MTGNWGRVGQSTTTWGPLTHQDQQALSVPPGEAVLRTAEAGVTYELSPAVEEVMPIWHETAVQATGHHRFVMLLPTQEQPAAGTLTQWCADLTRHASHLTAQHPLLVELDWVGHRLLDVVTRLHREGQGVGLLEPNNVVWFTGSDGQRHLVLPDVGFQWCGYGALPDWLSEQQRFRALWDDRLPADINRQAPTIPTDLATVARLFDWVLSDVARSHFPDTVDTKHPVYDVLRVHNGKITSAADLKENLSQPGASLSAYFLRAREGKPPVPGANSLFGLVAGVLLLLLLLGGILVGLLANRPDKPEQNAERKDVGDGDRADATKDQARDAKPDGTLQDRPRDVGPDDNLRDRPRPDSTKPDPGSFVGGDGATRKKLLKENGGNEQSEEAVARGLEWLALHQAQQTGADDGRWSLDEFNRHAREKPYPDGKIFTDTTLTGMSARKNDIAATAFGLLPFLAGGQTHRPSKNTQKDYSKSVKAGLDYLVRKQDKQTGFFGGDMYAHALATIVLCEAYDLTSDNNLKASAQLGIHYIETAQDPSGGGWRYAPRTPGDLSVTGWQVMALKSGQMSGLKVSDAVMKKAEQFLKSCEVHRLDPADGKMKHMGGYSYQPKSDESPTMTAVGMLCALYLGTTPRNPELIRGAAILRANPPGATKNLYYEYYATQVMYHLGGDNWKFWNEGTTGKNGIRDTLMAKQDLGVERRSQMGSFAQEGDGVANDGGRIMATSLSLLTLEVYYRYLPLYRRDMNPVKDAK